MRARPTPGNHVVMLRRRARGQRQAQAFRPRAVDQQNAVGGHEPPDHRPDSGWRHRGWTRSRRSDKTEIAHPETSRPKRSATTVKAFCGKDPGLCGESTQRRIGESSTDPHQEVRYRPGGAAGGERGETVVHRRVDLNRRPAGRVHHQVLQRVQGAQRGQRLVAQTDSKDQGHLRHTVVVGKVEHPDTVNLKLVAVSRPGGIFLVHRVILSGEPTVP